MRPKEGWIRGETDKTKTLGGVEIQLKSSTETKDSFKGNPVHLKGLIDSLYFNRHFPFKTNLQHLGLDSKNAEHLAPLFFPISCT